MNLILRYILLSALVFCIPVSSWAEQTLNLGVYAYQSKTKTTQQYQGLSNYLSEQLPNYSVNLKILSPNEILDAVRNKQVDFILVNPNLHQIIRHEVKLNGITATQQKHYKDQTLNSLGGVIFSLKENHQIRQARDLIKAKIAIPSFSNTGAFRIPLHELHTQGIHRKQLNFIEVGNNDAVIEAVLQGQAEAGFVRTGIIENWIKENKINADTLHIINAKDYPSFPQRLSTKLYPEWPFIILPNVNKDLTRKITVALFRLDKDHPALAGSGLAGFTTPQDYLAFENLLRELQLYPYNQNPLSLRMIWHEYQTPIMLSITIVALLLLFVLFNEAQNRKINHQRNELRHKNQLDEALLSLPKLAEKLPEHELMQQAVEFMEKLTLSKVSFIHFIDDAKKQVELITWSKHTLEKYCHIKDYDTHYDLESAGVWAEAARKHIPVMINNYAEYAHTKGLPDGHSEMYRLLSVPVLENDKVKLVAGVGNKDDNYTKHDVSIMQLILNELWRLIKDKRTNSVIEKQKNEYQHLLDNLGNDYVVFSHTGQEGVLTFVSEGVETVFEQSKASLLNNPWFAKINWDDASIQLAHQAISDLVNKNTLHNEIVMSFYTPSGTYKHILVQQRAFFKEDKLIAVEGLVTNISDRVKIEQRLKQAALVFTNTNEGIMITDSNNHIIRVNQQFSKITGYTEEEALGKNPNFLSSGHQPPEFYKTLWRSLLEEGSWKGEIWNRRKNGESYPQNLSIACVKDQQGEIREFVAIMADITFEKEQERKLERMAHYDALTNLPNRFLLSDRITQAITNSFRNKGSIAVMFMDLDGFKLINDEFGHDAGDYLLKTLAQRFQLVLRAGDSISRIGGDEFVVVLTSHKHMDAIESVQHRLLKASTQPVSYSNHNFTVSSSIGVVIYSPAEHEEEYGSEHLIRLADQSMYKAKELGKNRVHIHNWGEPANEFKLQQALKNKELVLYYQPKVDFSDDSAPSFEALIRWKHPEQGILPPAAFLHHITTAENQIKLAEFVIEEALKFINELNKNTGLNVEISVNVDSSFLLQEKLTDYLTNLFENAYPNISPKALTLEILESSALGDMQEVSQAIIASNSIGLKVAIDDFGTGHASLNYLKELPADIIKIDQAFVRNIFMQPNNVSILEAIHSMAEAFEMEVIAEGVETLAHIELLLKLGIHHLQGYGLSKPMPEAEVLSWLQSWKVPESLSTMSTLDNESRNFLKAELYHQAWNLRIKGFVHKDQILTKTETNEFNCPFGRWLESKSGNLIHNPNTIHELQIQHHNVHEIANMVIHAKNNGDQELAIQYLGQLDEQTQNLLTMLRNAAEQVNRQMEHLNT